MSAINDAQLGIYGVLSLPVIYLVYRHGIRGALGWGYLFIFCTLRVVGPAMQISDNKKGQSSSTATVISSIGLSPLLLATVGILHEARKFRNPKSSNFFERLFVLILHLLAAQGIGMVAAGSSALKGGYVSSTDLFLIKFGIGTLEFTLVVIVAWALVSLLPFQCQRNAPGYRDGSKVLYAVLFTLISTGIRVLYSVVAIFTRIQDLVNPPIGLRVGLSFMPELVTVLCFVAAGFVTKNVRSAAKEEESMRLGRRSQNLDLRRAGESGTGLKYDTV